MSRKVGYVGQRKTDGRWFARVMKDGKQTIKYGKSKEHAEWILKCLQTDPSLLLQPSPFDQGSPTSKDSKQENTNPAGPPFSKVLAEFIALRITKPVYRNDKKISGVRSRRTLLIRCNVLRDAFGDVSVG